MFFSQTNQIQIMCLSLFSGEFALSGFNCKNCGKIFLLPWKSDSFFCPDSDSECYANSR